MGTLPLFSEGGENARRREEEKRREIHTSSESMGSSPFAFSLLTVLWSSRKSVLHPTMMKGTVEQKFLSSGIHYDQNCFGESYL
jgi:hypothetical protein